MISRIFKDTASIKIEEAVANLAPPPALYAYVSMSKYSKRCNRTKFVFGMKDYRIEGQLGI